MAGMQSGVSMVFLKWFGETIAQNIFGPTECIILTVCSVVAVASSVLQLIFVNSAIARYQQIEVSAVYQVMIIIWLVVCALLLLDEGDMYTTSNLLLIMLGIAFCILGIQVVSWKTNHL